MTDTPLRPDELAFLRDMRVARLATLGSDGTASLVPVCFAIVEGDIPALVSVLDEKPKHVADRELARVRNIRRDSRVSVIVDRYDEDWAKLAFLQIKGHARIVDPGQEEHGDAITALCARYPQYNAMAIDQRPVIRIDIIRANSWGL